MKGVIALSAVVLVAANVCAANGAGLGCFKLADAPSPVYYTASSPIEKGSKCTVAVLVVHGWGGGVKANGEVAAVSKALAAAADKNAAAPYVIGPMFPTREGLMKRKAGYDGRAVWNDSWGKNLAKPGSPDDDWRGGGDAAGVKFSSFDAIDLIFGALGDRKMFPNLKRVVLAGYSAGGQFVGRYVAVGKGVVRDGVEVRYAAMAPSTELRLDSGVVWHYGTKDRPRYPAAVPEKQMLANLSSRRVWRACGTADVKKGALDVCPAAMAQGANRYERFRNFEKYLKKYPKWAGQVSFHDIPGVGHDSRPAYSDGAFVEYVLK